MILKNVRKQKLQVRRALHRLANSMKPGLYRVEPQIASQVGVRPVKNLMGARRADLRRRSRLIYVALVLIYRLTPPLFVWLRRGTVGPDVASRTYNNLLLGNGGTIKLFSTDQSTVQIHVADPKDARLLVEAHQTLGRHLPVTPLRHTETDYILEEPYVNGYPFWTLSLDQQVAIYKMLLRTFADITQYRSEPPLSFDKAKQSLLFTAETFSPRGLSEKHLQEAIALLVQSPLTPSHGDLHGDNILINGGQPTIIDLDKYAYRPFFFDALSVPFLNAHRYSDLRLLKAFRDGKFDSEFANLFKAAGMRQYLPPKGVMSLSYISQEKSRWAHRIPQSRGKSRTTERWVAFMRVLDPNAFPE